MGKVRKYWKLLLGLGLSILLIGLLVRFSVFNQSLSDTSKETEYELNIALVNEDQGGKLNNVAYNFGKNFTKYVNGDAINNWNVTSRGIADRGLKDSTYDLEIIIPANFTQQSIQLGSSNPQSAEITYKLNPNRNEDRRFAAKQGANKVLGNFNKKIVNVYFSSIVGNLHQAQVNVNNILKQENTLNSGLSININTPFSKLNSQFQGLTSESDSAQSGYESWKQRSEVYNNQVNSNLESMIENNKSAVQSMGEYSDRQNQMFEDNKAGVQQNYDEFITQETEINTKWFSKLDENDQQASDLYKGLMTYVKDKFGIEGPYSDDVDVNPTITSAISQIKRQNEGLKTTLKDELDENPFYTTTQSLVSQKRTEINYFFGNQTDEIANTDLTQTLMENHLAQDIQSGLDAITDASDVVDTDINSSYLEYLNQVIAKIPSNSNDAATIVASMGNNTESSEQIKNEIALTTKYNSENKNVNYGKMADFTSDFNDVTGSTKSQQGKEVIVTLPADSGKSIIISAATNPYVAWDVTAAFDDLSEKLPDDYVIKISGNTVKISKLAVTQEPETSEESQADVSNPKITEQTVASVIKFTPSFTVQGSIITTASDTSSITAKIKIDDRATEQKTISVDGLFNNSRPQGTDYVATANNINLAYNLIALFYGGDASQNLAGFDSDKKLKDQASDNSVQQSTSNQAIAKRVAKSIANQKYQLVMDNLTSMDDQIETLKKQQDDWTKMLETQDQNVSDLTALIADIQKNMPNWPGLDETKIETKPVEPYEYKVDLESGPKMVAQFSELSNSANEMMSATKKAATKVPDMADTFKQLKAATDTLNNQSQSMIKDSNNLTTSWTNTVTNNGKYNDGFQKVLANTKNGGADNQKVYDYLTNPVNAQNAGDIKTKVSFVPYYLVLISIFTALFSAYLLSIIEQRRKITKADKFKNTDSVFWQNSRWTGIIIVTGLVEGLLLTTFAWQALKAASVNMTVWMLVIMTVQSIFVSGFSYLIRQLKSIGMLIIVALVALYLFFTPSIGVKIVAMSGTDFIASMLPFQAIENIYTTLLNTAAISSVAIGALVIGTMITGVLNLVVERHIKVDKSKNGGAQHED